MNKTMTSIIALGIGAAAYRVAQRNNTFGNMVSKRGMKRMRRNMAKAFNI